MSERKIEEILQLSAEEAKELLPSILDEIGKSSIGKVLEKYPGLLSKIMGKLIEIDAAKFLSEVPEFSDKFMDLLWEGVNGLALKSDELKSVLARTREVNVNLEASDSPLTAHFTTSQGRLSGGSGLLHFKDQDFRFFGSTEVLLRLLSGKLPLGFSNPWLLTDGIHGFLPLLGPIMQGMSKLINAK